MGHLHSLFSLPGVLFVQKPESQAPKILQVSPQRNQPGVPDYHVLNSKSNHLPHTHQNPSDWYFSVVPIPNHHIYIGTLCGLVRA